MGFRAFLGPIFQNRPHRGCPTSKGQTAKNRFPNKNREAVLSLSVSRFVRNTLDCIHHVRLLKSWGISVIFEKEGIDTSDMNSEMILICLSAFA